MFSTRVKYYCKEEKRSRCSTLLLLQVSESSSVVVVVDDIEGRDDVCMCKDPVESVGSQDATADFN